MAGCEQLATKAEVKALEAKIFRLEALLPQKLDKSEKPKIIKASIFGAKAELMPVIKAVEALVLLTAAALWAAIGALRRLFSSLIPQIKEALAKAIQAFQKGLEALAKAIDARAIAERALTKANANQQAIDQLEDYVGVLEGRIAEANRKSNQAIRDANAAIEQSNRAIGTANAAITRASNALSTANTAESKAQRAQSTANAADGKAGRALQAANAADAKAGTAINKADAADAKAGRALQTANAADAKAGTAINKADAADAKAGRALQTANVADAKAGTAINKADIAQSVANVAKALALSIEGIARNALAEARAASAAAERASNEAFRAKILAIDAQATAHFARQDAQRALTQSDIAQNIAKRALYKSDQAIKRADFAADVAMSALSVAGDALAAAEALGADVSSLKQQVAGVRSLASVAIGAAGAAQTKAGAATDIADIMEPGRVKELEKAIAAIPGLTAGRITNILNPTLQRIVAQTASPAISRAAEEAVCRAAQPNRCLGNPLGDILGDLGNLLDLMNLLNQLFNQQYSGGNLDLQGLQDAIENVQTTLDDRAGYDEVTARVYSILGGFQWYPDNPVAPIILNAVLPKYDYLQRIQQLGYDHLGEQLEKKEPRDVYSIIDLIAGNQATLYYRLGLQDYPVSVPADLSAPSTGDADYMEMLHPTRYQSWLVRQIDALLGQYPIKIHLEDSDLIKVGDQPVDISLPNVAESLAELAGMAIYNQAKVDALLGVVLRNLIETGSNRQQSIVSYHLLQGIQEYLGYTSKEKIEEIDFTFNPLVASAESPEPESLTEALKPSKIKVKVEENDDKDNLSLISEKTLSFTEG